MEKQLAPGHVVGSGNILKEAVHSSFCSYLPAVSMQHSHKMQQQSDHRLTTQGTAEVHTSAEKWMPFPPPAAASL